MLADGRAVPVLGPGGGVDDLVLAVEVRQCPPLHRGDHLVHNRLDLGRREVGVHGRQRHGLLLCEVRVHRLLHGRDGLVELGEGLGQPHVHLERRVDVDRGRREHEIFGSRLRRVRDTVGVEALDKAIDKLDLILDDLVVVRHLVRKANLCLDHREDECLLVVVVLLDEAVAHLPVRFEGLDFPVLHVLAGLGLLIETSDGGEKVRLV
mmetsp:Transcript_8930/g.20882  ORF Transcript_8930/g.20882 Transcript_8930/m.20882 type:complete len:208 (-) Transcript_8930:181-804(-)